MANKALYLTRTYTKSGKEAVGGAVKIFLRKPYGTTDMSVMREVNVGSNTRTVCNVEGSIKLDDYMVKQLKYFFNKDVPSGSYLNVRVGVWGSMGKAISKFNLADGDIYMFMVQSAELQNFNKKDGSVGYQLNVNAFDFEPIRTGRGNQNGGNNSQHTQNAAPVQQNNAGAVADDFEAIDESDDLPF